MWEVSGMHKIHPHSGVLCSWINKWGRSQWTDMERVPGYIAKWKKESAEECLYQYATFNVRKEEKWENINVLAHVGKNKYRENKPEIRIGYLERVDENKVNKMQELEHNVRGVLYLWVYLSVTFRLSES